MKTLVAILAATVLTGCAVAPHLDREYGAAQGHSWDRQVAHPDYRYAAREPEGLEGIHAEEVMNVHNSTFAEKTKKASLPTLGVSESKR